MTDNNNSNSFVICIISLKEFEGHSSQNDSTQTEAIKQITKLRTPTVIRHLKENCVSEQILKTNKRSSTE